MNPTFIILSGGKSTRFGSDKASILLDGEPLIVRILKSLPVGDVVIVGPEFQQPHRKAIFVLENPPGGGPVAAIAAALPVIDSDEIYIVATDMPFAHDIVPLLSDQHLRRDALIPIDAEGKRQPLCARYRREALLFAVEKLGDPHGKSMKDLLSEISLEEFTVESSFMSKLVDIDTPQDLVNLLDNLGEELDGT